MIIIDTQRDIFVHTDDRNDLMPLGIRGPAEDIGIGQDIEPRIPFQTPVEIVELPLTWSADLLVTHPDPDQESLVIVIRIRIHHIVTEHTHIGNEITQKLEVEPDLPTHAEGIVI